VGTSLPNVDAGDVDSKSQYWVTVGGVTWVVIDLNPGSSNYTKIIGEGKAKPFGFEIADWVYFPLFGDYLYSVVANTTSSENGRKYIRGTAIIRFNMVSHEWEKVANYPDLRHIRIYGAQYGLHNGTLYAENNDDGVIYQFDLTKPGLVQPFPVSNGPKGSPNDGARCVQNLTQ
jgi:hypothetical protein